MDSTRLLDDEIVYRRIPRSDDWFEEPDRIKSTNFKLDHRREESGISVYRAAIVTAEQVKTKPDAIPASLVAQATVGEIRRLVNGDKIPKLLGLDVIVVDDEDDPGHSEIRGPEPGKITKAASSALRNAFRLI